MLKNEPDRDSLTNEKLPEIRAILPLCFGLFVQLDVVCYQPFVIHVLIDKVPASLNNCKGENLDLNSSHQGKSGGLIGASGVLADSVGIVVGLIDKIGTLYVN